MWKVFLVEDESVIREGFRDNIPWEQYGFQFVGEAADGEMALPLIRKEKPDVLITDIKMPFMDGLSLSEIVREELPKTKIIIISGYDDFEYARQAIRIGVDQYLLKPVTRMALRNVLTELRGKLEKETEQDNYQDQYYEEAREYEQFAVRRFFEGVLDGSLSVREIYEKASALSMDLNASGYNLLLFTMHEKGDMVDRDQFMRTQEEIFHYFLRNPHYILFRLNVNSYGILVKGEEAELNGRIDGAINHIQNVMTRSAAKISWYIAVGSPVARISALPECYREANHCFAYRFMLPQQNILSAVTLKGYLESNDEKEMENVDFLRMDPEIIREFLTNGEEKEIHDFVESYLKGIAKPLHSNMFRSYVVLNIRFAAVAFLESIGAQQSEYQKDFESAVNGVREDEKDIFLYFVKVLEIAMRIRDQINDRQGSHMMHRVLAYIDEHYSDEEFSLSVVAEQTEVSPNYLSAIFSQMMKMTFIEYVTQKRIEQAKKLLTRTDKSSGEIAKEVGYKDAHYFSFVFKKVQGCSPREYRMEK